MNVKSVAQNNKCFYPIQVFVSISPCQSCISPRRWAEIVKIKGMTAMGHPSVKVKP